MVSSYRGEQANKAINITLNTENNSILVLQEAKKRTAKMEKIRENDNDHSIYKKSYCALEINWL